jgi:hypothetical protein
LESLPELEKETMNFTNALAAVFKEGDRVTRRSWNSRSVYVTLEDGQLCIKGFPDDGQWHPWVITESDFFSEDWEIVSDG